MKIRLDIEGELQNIIKEEKEALFLWLMKYPEGERGGGKFAPIKLEIAGLNTQLKRESYPGLYERLKGAHRFTLFGLSKSESEWRNLKFLKQIGVPVPDPLAFGECRRCGFLHQGFLLTKYIPDTLNLDQWLVIHAIDRNMRKKLLENMAVILAQIHQAHFYYKDLHWRNILIDNHGNVYLIDCPKAKIIESNWWMKFAAAADLGTLDTYASWYFTKSERLRFFRKYLSYQTILKPEDEKRILMWIRLWKALTLRKDRKKNRTYYHIHSNCKKTSNNSNSAKKVS